MTDKTMWELRRAQDEDDMAACWAIRHQVFVREQCVDQDLERDGKDGLCLQYIACDGCQALGTARVLATPDRFKIQRMAVLSEARGSGLGAALLRFIIADIVEHEPIQGRHFFLSAQVHALPFYERLGFVVCSDEYVEADIPHRDMRRAIAASG